MIVKNGIGGIKLELLFNTKQFKMYKNTNSIDKLMKCECWKHILWRQVDFM